MNDLVPDKAAQPSTPWAAFEVELRQREEEILNLLPQHIDREKFMTVAAIAVKNNPELLQCDRRSLHAAITRAAEDGLQPDGREGVINVYKEKRLVNGREIWTKVAAWIPMVYGIRKRARELANIIIDAQIVCENDTFVWRQGDDPLISHEPASLGSDPGARVGCYAIFKTGNDILHREVMRRAQIEAVKSCAKAQNGLLWTKFEDEAWRKTVVRRGIKTVPSVPESLTKILSRDDDQYSFDRVPSRAVSNIPEIPDIPLPTAVVAPIKRRSLPPVDIPDAETEPDWSGDALLKTIERKLQQATSIEQVIALERDYAVDLMRLDSDLRDQAVDMIEGAKQSFQPA